MLHSAVCSPSLHLRFWVMSDSWDHLPVQLWKGCVTNLWCYRASLNAISLQVFSNCLSLVVKIIKMDRIRYPPHHHHHRPPVQVCFSSVIDISDPSAAWIYSHYSLCRLICEHWTLNSPLTNNTLPSLLECLVLFLFIMSRNSRKFNLSLPVYKTIMIKLIISL